MANQKEVRADRQTVGANLKVNFRRRFPKGLEFPDGFFALNRTERSPDTEIRRGEVARVDVLADKPDRTIA